MRIYILTHDEQVFHPLFFQRVLNAKPPGAEVIGAALVSRVKSETTAQSLSHLYHVGGVGGVTGVAVHLLRSRLDAWFGDRELAGVRPLFASRGIPVRDVASPNQPDFVAWLGEQKPDIVYSSITNLLKTPLLRTPRLGCVNRHSGKLPDYRGAEPVFHALRRDEPTVTVTYHSMVEQLDGGSVLWEHTEPVRKIDSVFSVYERLFRLAAGGFWPAMQAMESGAVLRAVDLSRGAVYKRPTMDEINEYRSRGRRYI